MRNGLENYHTHTARCKHASGSVADYAKNAVKNGIAVLGISDHTPLPDGRWLNVRMHMDDLAGYIAEIRAAQKAHPGLIILTAVECEGFTEYNTFYRDTLLNEHHMDYLIGGNHYFRVNGTMSGVYDNAAMDLPALHAYADHVIATIASGLFAFVAHPDLFGYSYLNWDAETVAISRDIASAAASYRIPLEINGYGMRKPAVKSETGMRAPYPLEKFWEIAAAYDISVVANSDAHRPEDVAAGIAEGSALASRYGLRLADIRGHIGNGRQNTTVNPAL
ncbi:MAG: histidinol-phosphatase [Spirochaetes bacterium]|nr:histidinol-phosphatase [Spirochaetota bacterium]